MIQRMIVSFLLWPIESLFVMVGLMLLHEQGFSVPASGYWSCFPISLALSLFYDAATIAHEINEEL